MRKLSNVMFLDEKIERAVKILKENEPPEGYFVAFSGGKDSIVVYDIVKKANVKHEVHFHVSTVDPPELLQFIREYYPEVVWDRPKYNMLQLIEKNRMLPMRTLRFCCRYLKEYHGKGRVVVDGVRAKEYGKNILINILVRMLMKENVFVVDFEIRGIKLRR